MHIGWGYSDSISVRQMISKILLVSPDQTDEKLVNLIQEAFEGPLEIHKVHDYPEAVDLLDGRGGHLFDVVLMDSHLPTSNQLQTIANVFFLSKHMPLIVITENDEADVALGSLRSGATNVISRNDLNSRELRRIVLVSVEMHRNKLKNTCDLNGLVEKFNRIGKGLKEAQSETTSNE